MSYRRVSFQSRVLVCFACSCISLARLSFVEIRDYSQSNKEIAFVTRDGYLEEELLTELIVPLLLNHTIYVDPNFLIFSSSLLLLLSTMASCATSFPGSLFSASIVFSQRQCRQRRETLGTRLRLVLKRLRRKSSTCVCLLYCDGFFVT